MRCDFSSNIWVPKAYFSRKTCRRGRNVAFLSAEPRDLGFKILAVRRKIGAKREIDIPDLGPGGLCSGDLPIVLFPDSPKHAYYSGIIPRNCPFKPSFLELNIPHIVPKCATSCTHPTECLEQNQRIIWDHLNPHFWGRRKRGAYYSGIFYSADPPYYSKSSASIIRRSLVPMVH